MENQIQSYRDTTRILLEQDLAVMNTLDKRLRKRYEEGYDKGWREAKARYCVTYFCSVCGGTIEVETDNEKQAIRRYMRERGWGHGNCVKQHG